MQKRTLSLYFALLFSFYRNDSLARQSDRKDDCLYRHHGEEQNGREHLSKKGSRVLMDNSNIKNLSHQKKMAKRQEYQIMKKESIKASREKISSREDTGLFSSWNKKRLNALMKRRHQLHRNFELIRKYHREAFKKRQ